MNDNETVETKKTKKAKKEEALVESIPTLVNSNDLSAVFFSQFNTAMPEENKKSTGIIENFVILFRRSISTFLGRKIEFHFDNMKRCELKSLHLDTQPYVLSNVLFAPQNQSGLIFFDYAFIHFVIDILYGAGNYKNASTISSLGKSGIVIAKKVIELCSTALQEAISEYEKVQISPLKTTEQPGLILNQPLPEHFFDLHFYADFNGKRCEFHIAIPDALFKDITAQKNIPSIENNDSSTVNTSIKKDIIDSTITLIATLHDIKLKITDIMSLKTGDLIPIQDPTIVYMSHNQKKIFKGSVGQSNAQRVVKILDNLQ